MNIESHLRTEIGDALGVSSRELFDEAQIKIQGLLESDSYVRFLQSDLYTDLVKGEQEREKCQADTDKDIPKREAERKEPHETVVVVNLDKHYELDPSDNDKRRASISGM